MEMREDIEELKKAVDGILKKEAKKQEKRVLINAHDVMCNHQANYTHTTTQHKTAEIDYQFLWF
ncbi:hypothetical protein SPBRAN_882 [uncultured Candidatus Thioglobus sp.]|nr:hypothetical protein SPBRAN_882 [uncultured Candidatus Thioglobus sp.]